jgi:hypothetical protein
MPADIPVKHRLAVLEIADGRVEFGFGLEGMMDLRKSTSSRGLSTITWKAERV